MISQFRDFGFCPSGESVIADEFSRRFRIVSCAYVKVRVDLDFDPKSIVRLTLSASLGQINGVKNASTWSNGLFRNAAGCLVFVASSFWLGLSSKRV